MTDTNGHDAAAVPTQPPLSAENAAVIQLTWNASSPSA